MVLPLLLRPATFLLSGSPCLLACPHLPTQASPVLGCSHHDGYLRQPASPSGIEDLSFLLTFPLATFTWVTPMALSPCCFTCQMLAGLWVSRVAPRCSPQSYVHSLTRHQLHLQG